MQDLSAVNESPMLSCIKDSHSTFVAFSPALAKLVGFMTSDNALGKTDFDLPCDAVEFAKEFVRMDKRVFETKKKVITIDIQPYCPGWQTILVEKNPLQDVQGNVTGILHHAINISDVNLFKNYMALYTFDLFYRKKSIKPVSYILTDSYNPFSLTKKQECCLFLLIRGKSIKEIATVLDISPRTVESHLEAIKNKLKCQYKSELIEKALDAGFLFYVPAFFQNIEVAHTLI